MLCIDLLTLLQTDNLVEPGKRYWGVLRCKLPSEGNIHGDQYEFKEVEIKLAVSRRNVHLFVGKYITITLRADGSRRLNLRNINLDDVNSDTFCLELMTEIRQALKNLVGNS